MNKVKGFWNKLKADWYLKGLGHSTFSHEVLDIIEPLTDKCRTFMDIGSGCGTLSIPLAASGKLVTAIDSSEAMLLLLKEECLKQEIRNIDIINTSWEDAEPEPHDVVICANVPELIIHSDTFTKEINSIARKFVFLITGADPNADKFYYRSLYPILFQKQYGPRVDYIKTYTSLHKAHIFANIKIIEYDFNQPFQSISEAVEFWKEYLSIVTEEHDNTIENFLLSKLERDGNSFIARFRKKAAIIWWEK